MEDRQPGQTPERPITNSNDATAARTRPVDAGAPSTDEADRARVTKSGADAAVAAMTARGFGSHKGTEAD